MWHEARKQEKKIRGMLVDYRKRAERRQDFYERIKADPTQFLQVHGRKCKIHLDASVATAAENPAIMQVIFNAFGSWMPWQGQKDNMIDRFDVRAHLDYIPPVPRSDPEAADQQEEDADERAMNYERYRVLAQNEFLGTVEEKFLHQLYLEEQFGVNAQVEAETKAAAAASKKKSSAGAAIGYTYEETETVAAGGSGLSGTGSGTGPIVPFVQSITAIEKSSEASSSSAGGAGGSARFDECMKDESDSDLDMDVSIDINKIGNAQAHELNSCGRQYGMKSNDFYSFLTKDADEADALRMAREEEQEKIMFSGRKSRRERRAQRERKFAGRPLSPPSYAAKEELVPRTFVETNDSSRSPSPVNSGKITYITSFGGEDELQAHAKISFGFNRDMSTLGGIAGSSKASRMRAGISGGSAAEGGGTVSYADKVKQNLEKLKAQESKESDRKPPMQYQRTAAMGRRSRGKGSRSSSRSSRSSSSSSGHSRSRSRGRRRSFHSSRSRSRGRSKSPGAGARGARRRPRGRTGGGHRSRSRSRGVEPTTGRAGTRGVTTRQAYSRYRAARSKSKSRSRSHSRSPSRTRSRPRWSPRRRSPPPSYTSRRRRSAARSSSSSSSSSTSSSRSRSRTPSSRRPAAQQPASARTKRAGSGPVASDSETSPSRTTKKIRAQATAISQEKPSTALQPASGMGMAPQAILSTLPPLLPPPPPPPPAIGEVASSDVVDEKKPIAALALIEPEPEVPIKRYYGRRRGDESSSDALSTSGEEDTNEGDRKPRGLVMPDAPLGEETAVGTTSNGGGGPAPTSTTTTTTSSLPASKSVNPRDRLKRKMQILLNKQYKADKKAEIEKVERQIQQQQERDDEMRELALKLRRRQRELRHKYGTPESEHSKSASSGDDRSSDEGGGGDGGQRFGGPGATTGRDASTSPQRLPLLSPPPLTSVPPPKMPSHSPHTSRPPPSLMVGRGGAAGYGNSVVIERKPVLRSASDSGGSTAQAAPPPMASYRADMGRLRRRNTPPPAPGLGGGSSSRGFSTGPGGGGMSSSPMTLRRGGGGGGGGGGGMTAGRPPPASSSGGSRFDDRSRRRSPQRYNRSRSKSRERFPSRDTTGQMGTGGNRGHRMPEYGRSRDYDRYHHSGGGGDVAGSGYQSGTSSGRFRGRRSRSGSRGRRSRSGSPVRTRGNGGGGGQTGSAPNRPREERTPKPVKKLVDY
ncbi:AGAP002614-PA-like protein [Anopheles sinensis]|uniref:AGAP002614-PA-like protein n=1 Tax=Anopheles sinensis TaxID=74873 RepID=A0A084WTN7_ANOSI|nr:AGAP002614-PA-like protein [Anopheles sinensis]